MKQVSFLLCIGVFTLFSCKPKTNPHINEDFDAYKTRFIENMWSIYPEWGTALGYHKYDSLLTIYNQDQIDKEMNFALSQRDSLKQFDVNQLSDLNKIDFKVIENNLNNIEFQVKELKAYEWDPHYYNVGESFAYVLSENYDSLDSRLLNFSKKLVYVPAYFEAAKENINDPSIEHLNLAIEQNIGSLSIFQQDLEDSLKASKLDDSTKLSIRTNAKIAADSIQAYCDWLKDLYNPNPRSFRLGKEIFEKKFARDLQSNFTSAQLYDSAVARKVYLHGQMNKITDQLWPKYFTNTKKPTDKLVKIKMMIDTLSVQHVKPEEFQSSIEALLPELTAFVKEKNLLYMDPSKPLGVRKEPGYMAGIAGASMSSPGPYEPDGKAYYNVGTLEGWEPERSESYLREYNQYILQILNIHEAIPGHYVQFIYSNKSPSIIKSVFHNGSMVEGWAMYSELMMMENGFHESPEMWLMYYKWNLRATCNTILDIGVHTRNMSEAESMNLLTRQAFQQQAEAEGKWKRVNVTNVQLCSYYNGFKEITDLRESYKKKMGEKYKLKAFNEKFLSYGSSPVKYIRELMLK